MLEIISIENTLESENSNNNLWKDLVIESYNKYRKYNDFSSEVQNRKDLKEFWDLIKSNEIHLVLRQNKFIGFFINTYHNKNKEISFKVFAHPLACPMSIRSITKAALFRSFIVLIENKDIVNLEFVTWHPSLASAIKVFIPDLKITMINSSTIICSKEVVKKDLENFSTILLKYLDSTQQLKKNHYKILY